jgi:ribosome biogenesis GTPase A
MEPPELSAMIMNKRDIVMKFMIPNWAVKIQKRALRIAKKVVYISEKSVKTGRSVVKNPTQTTGQNS